MRLVEASRTVDREQRVFFVSDLDQGTFIDGPGLSNEKVLRTDLEYLHRVNLLARTGGGAWQFVIPPPAIAIYEQLKTAGAPLPRQEEETRAWLDGERFRSNHPLAHQSWAEAELLLWRDDALAQQATIGFKLRESMQHFATSLLASTGNPQAASDPSRTKDRVSAAVNARRESLGTTTGRFLDALFDYWSAAIDLVQRQTHAAEREQEPLEWEDGRRAVLATAVVMSELDRALAL